MPLVIALFIVAKGGVTARKEWFRLCVFVAVGISACSALASYATSADSCRHRIISDRQR